MPKNYKTGKKTPYKKLKKTKPKKKKISNGRT